MFEQILDKDENIVETFKPNKFRLFMGNFIGSLFLFAFAIVICCLGFFIPDEMGNTLDPIWLLIPFGVYLVYLGLMFLFLSLWYNKTFYAFTNKRIIIRTGIIGVDFKALDLKMIGAVDVNVSLMDKIVGKNTGTLRFGSMSSPMSVPAGSKSLYAFAYIQNPYEIYKKVKEAIEQSKNQ